MAKRRRWRGFNDFPGKGFSVLFVNAGEVSHYSFYKFPPQMGQCFVFNKT